MSKGRKIIVGILVTLVVIFIVLFGVFRWFTTQALPKTQGTVQLEGVSAPIEIIRDEYGVAHIYADTRYDLFFGQGYVEAQERFWQMEFQRRVAAGRLSEFFGDATLETDRYLRHFGFPELAQQDYENLDGTGKAIIDAYTDGVNAYIKDRSPAQLGLEFGLLSLMNADITVEPWTPISSLGWVYMMILDQSGLGGTASDIFNADLLNAIGQEKYADLFHAFREDRPVIIPTEELQKMKIPTASVGANSLAYHFSIQLPEQPALERVLTQSPLATVGLGLNGGSNSFVISGEKTTTGMPILANDTHMLIQAPSLFYEVGLHCREKSEACPVALRGFSLAGLPGILIGHNDRIAWGLTNAAFDAEDVFIEKINPENPDQYEVNGQWVDMEIRQEEIWVRGHAEPELLTVRRTRHGIVASDAMVDPLEFNLGSDLPDPYAIVYAATTLQPIRSFQAVMGVNLAQDWDDFYEALRLFDAGKQNWLYADVDGNIGIITPGLVPIRAKGDGTLPLPGWNDEYAWIGYIPYEDMPKTLNPEKGYVITANQPQVSVEDYPYNLGTRQDRGQRAHEINQCLTAVSGGISIEDVMACQTDNRSISAQEIIPYLESLQLSQPAADARDRLLGWDTAMEMDSSEAVIYNYFWRELQAQIFHDQLPERHWPRGSTQIADVVYFLVHDPTSEWWDDTATANVEDRDTILTNSFEASFAQAVEELGDDIDQWRWGELHTIVFDHPTLGQTGIGFIDNIFNAGPYETAGSSLVPQNTAWDPLSGNFEVAWIPHIREVIDLGNLPNSWMIHQLGQSGHPMSNEYDNMADKWRMLEYIPTNWQREDVEAGKNDLLTIEPPG